MQQALRAAVIVDYLLKKSGTGFYKYLVFAFVESLEELINYDRELL